MTRISPFADISAPDRETPQTPARRSRRAQRGQRWAALVKINDTTFGAAERVALNVLAKRQVAAPWIADQCIFFRSARSAEWLGEEDTEAPSADVGACPRTRPWARPSVRHARPDPGGGPAHAPWSRPLFALVGVTLFLAGCCERSAQFPSLDVDDLNAGATSLG